MRFQTFVFMLMLCGVANAGLPESITVTRGYEDYPPMEFHEGKKLTGFHIELIEAVSSQLGIDVKFVSLPWKRAMHWAYKGDADAVSYVTDTPARAKKLIFLPENILSTTSISIIRNKHSTRELNFNGDLGVLKQRELVIPLGFKYGEPFDSFPFKHKKEIQRIDMIVNLVATRSSVLTVLNKEEFFFSHRDHPLIDHLEAVVPEIQKSDNYLGFSRAKGLEDLANAYAKALAAYKSTNAYKALREKYELEP